MKHALSLLTEEGYIEPRERSGCYVTYREDSSYAAPRPHERKAAPPVKAELRDEGERDLSTLALRFFNGKLETARKRSQLLDGFADSFL